MDSFKIDNFDKNLWFVNDARETNQRKLFSYSFVGGSSLFINNSYRIYYELAFMNLSKQRQVSITEGGNIVCGDVK